jgi:hypothetical protein
VQPLAVAGGVMSETRFIDRWDFALEVDPDLR